MANSLAFNVLHGLAQWVLRSLPGESIFVWVLQIALKYGFLYDLHCLSFANRTSLVYGKSAMAKETIDLLAWTQSLYLAGLPTPIVVARSQFKPLMNTCSLQGTALDPQRLHQPRLAA